MNIVMLGPAGSGKGTQAEKIADKFDLIHIDMGGLLRQMAKKKNALGKKVNEIINIKRELVSSQIAKKAIHVKLKSIPKKKGIIFDGVPRNTEQMEYLHKVLSEFGRKLDKVFYIDISQKEAFERIKKRVVCEKCKMGFILGRDIKSLNEQCPTCEGRLVQREDDTKNGIKKRFLVFQRETSPILKKYKNNNLLEIINGESSINRVYTDILNKLF